nr:MAG: capsid protein [Cressdnaviricota sp.]
MVYKKKFTKKTYRKRKLTKPQRRQVKTIVARETEWKQFDNITTATTASSAGTIIGGLILPSQGVADSQRTGDVIFIKSVSIHGNFICADATQMFRTILFRWRPDNAIDTPSVAKLLQDTSSLPWASAINETSLQAGKINILHDKTYAMVLNTQSGVKQFSWKFYGKKLGKKKIAFNSGAVTGMDQLYMLIISDSLAVAHPAINFNCRTIYSDA